MLKSIYIKVTKIIAKYIYEHLFFIGFLLGIVFYSLFILFWFRAKILLVLIPLAVFIALIILKIKTNFYFKSLKTDTQEKDHVAVIFVKYGFLKNISYTFSKEKRITSILEEHNILSTNYVIETSQQLEQILLNPKVRAVVILGHGKRHILGLKRGVYFYCDFLGKPTQIKYVAQLHCNDGSGKSLYEIIGCKGFDTSDLTHTSEVNDFIHSKKFIDSIKEAFK